MKRAATFRSLDDVMGSLRAYGYKQLPDTIWEDDNGTQIPAGPWFSYDPLHNCVEFTWSDNTAQSLWQVNIFFCKEHDSAVKVRYTTHWWGMDGSLDSLCFPGVKEAERVAMVLAGWSFEERGAQ